VSAADLKDGFEYHEGIVRTSLDCHSCGKVFIAKLNFDLSGNHQILCPYCGHEHWRVIKKGVVTGDRYGSQNGPNREVSTERMWSDTTLPIQTTSVSRHIRDRWLAKN
jgi:DNA-directed RNA polymerase subunit RPC12/RpoP